MGIAAVQLARAAGLQVIGSAGTDRGLDLVLEQGAHHVLDHTEEGSLAELNALTAGKGVNVILERLAKVNLGNDLNFLARGGRVLPIGNRGGNSQGHVEINPRAVMVRDEDILCMTLYNASAQQQKGFRAAIVAGLANGTLQPVIGQEFSLEEVVKAHHAVIDNRAYGKIVLIP
ncbi:MAG: NADPH2:quinone reductase [Gammaproteobacteria bacterium]